MYRCVAGCLSHRTICVSYIFVSCVQVCGKLFESQDKLDIHRQVHLQSANGTFTCPHCGEICKNWRPFLYHLSKHDTDGGKKYTCQVNTVLCWKEVCSLPTTSYSVSLNHPTGMWAASSDTFGIVIYLCVLIAKVHAQVLWSVPVHCWNYFHRVVSFMWVVQKLQVRATALNHTR